MEKKENKRYITKLTKQGYSFTKSQEKTLAVWLDHDELYGDWVISPNKAGEFLGIDGKGLQNKCRSGKIFAYHTFYGWWKIPISEILKIYNEMKTCGKL